jgi:uncharacterized protein
MQIQLSEVLDSEGKVMKAEAFYEPDCFQTQAEKYQIVEKKPVLFEFTNHGAKKIWMEAVIDMSLEMRCDRCLKPVIKNFSMNIAREFDMKETEAQRVEALDETPFLHGEVLDVDEFVYGEIFMGLPMKVLCREDCKGICSHCGTDLNDGTCGCDTAELDPRMAKIRDIFLTVQKPSGNR